MPFFKGGTIEAAQQDSNPALVAGRNQAKEEGFARGLMNSRPFIICLMGPTAVGKTDIAVELVQQLPCDIISVDSAMVYRGMDIGTAKPSADILKIAPHRLLDIKDPSNPYSAAQFCQDAHQHMTDILAANRIPLLVGGTMLYFRALQQGLSQLPGANPEVRAALLAEANLLGWPALHARLALLDPSAAQRIHPNDAQRLQRALEVYELTGKKLSEFFAAGAVEAASYEILNLALIPNERSLLQGQIALRFQRMLASGFIEEVNNLMQRGDLTADMPAMRAVGYRQVWDYLSNKLSYAEMEYRGIIATRQLAKRQMTWLRSWWQPLHVVDAQDEQRLTKISGIITDKIMGRRY